MKKSIQLAAIAGAVTLFSACADDVTNVYNEESGIPVLEKGKKLSKQSCDSTNVGEMLFVTDSSAVYFCNGKKWETLNGEDGEDGKDGADGKNGADGNTCSVKQNKDKSVTTITCETADGKVSYDVKNGEDGKDGEDGKAGENGKNGKNGADGDDCRVVDDGDGRVTVVCGEGDGESSAVVYKAMCGDVPFDPSAQLCDARDNQIYGTVTIGKQTWMAENLNYDLKKVEDGKGVRFNVCGGRGVGVDPDCERFGRLYTWAAAMDSANASSVAGGCGYKTECAAAQTEAGLVRGVCPVGWHLPTEGEWHQLASLVAGTENEAEYSGGKMLKSVDVWSPIPAPSTHELQKGEDTYGFTALPAGIVNAKGVQDGGFSETAYWSSTVAGDDEDNENAKVMSLSYDSNGIVWRGYDRRVAVSVRCVRD